MAVATTSKKSVSNSTKKVASNMAKKSKSNGKSPAKGTAKNAKTPVETMLSENEHLSNAVQQIEKQFGDGSIMTLGSDATSKIRGVSTGSLSLDMALGGQGLPCGRSSKSTGLNRVVKQLSRCT